MVKKVKYTFSEDGEYGFGETSTGDIFIFDSEDFDRISKVEWYTNTQGSHGEKYVIDRKGDSLHRFIMNQPTGQYVEHINLNPLDNRKSNLRLCSHRENMCNRDLQVNNTSGVSGVVWNKRRKTWNARIKYYGKEIHLGAYHSFIEAVQARNEGMKWFFGKFGRYNDVAEAPEEIKIKIAEKCSRILSGTAVFSIGGEDE